MMPLTHAGIEKKNQNQNQMQIQTKALSDVILDFVMLWILEVFDSMKVILFTREVSNNSHHNCL